MISKRFTVRRISLFRVSWKRGVAFLFFLFLGLPACQRQSSTSNNTGWFLLSQCRPPCWNGITPGETLDMEVVQILTSIESVSTNSVVESGGGQRHYDQWYEFEISDSTIFGFIAIIDGRVANTRFLRLENNVSSGSLSITLEEAINLAGTPEYLVRAEKMVPAEFIGEGFDTFVYLINTSVGFAFAYDEDRLPASERGAVREEIEIDEIYYFSPAEIDKLMEMRFLNLEIMDDSGFVDWIGYGEYPRGQNNGP